MRRFIMLFLLTLLILGGGVGVFAYNLITLQKTDGTGPVRYRNTQIDVKIPDKYEIEDTDFRAVWISHLVNDISTYSSKTQYISQMNLVFEVMEYYNLNAMVFHVRTHNNALYKSSLNPVSTYYRTVDFDAWDPVEWIIEECHKRGIEFHAWMNPYRLSTTYSGTVEQYAALQPNYNIASDPSMILKSGNSLILNPGEPNVRNFIIDTVLEFMENYNADAIHFDDYFYISGVDDLHTRNKYNVNNLSLGDFRRQQVDIFIEDLYDAMRDFNIINNRIVQLGISPSGIYRNGGYVSLDDYTYNANGDLTYPLYSNTSGFAHYDNYLYSDTKKWIDNHWIDYIIPQIYWAFEQPVAPFADITDWWAMAVKNKDVNLYSGMGLYMIGGSTAYSWQGPEGNEALNQILYSSKYAEVQGHCIFSFRHIKFAYQNTTNALYRSNFTKVKEQAWNNVSILPEIRTYDPVTLGSVQSLGFDKSKGYNEISFAKLEDAKFYVIYRSTSPLTYSPSEVVNVIGGSSEMIAYADIDGGNANYYYGVKPMSITNTLGSEAYIITDIENRIPVTFKNDDGEILRINYVLSGQDAIPPVVSSRVGYTFAGWDKPFTNITEPIDITATFTLNAYQVRFLDDDGTIISTTQTYHGEDALAPSPIKEGYTFLGWNKSISNVTSNLDVTALYIINTYQVKFLNYDDTVLLTSNIMHGANAIAPIVDARVGYTFSGWDKSFLNVTDDLEVKVIFIPFTYEVRFINYDGTTIATVLVDHGTDAIAPNIEPREAFTFIGWNKSFTNVTSNLEVTALYESSAYLVRFMNYDQTIMEIIQVDHGEDAIAPNPPLRVGHTFIGWNKSFTNVTSDLDITALFEAIVYQIVFVDHDGTVLSNVNAEHGTEASKPSDPTRLGYQFIGWNQELNNITQNLEITALYRAYTITFKVNGNDVLVVNSEEEFDLPVIPTKAGHDKVEPVWSTYDFSNLTLDIDVEAIYTINTYTVTFVGHKNVILKEETVEWMNAATAPDAPDVVNYEFTVWDGNFSQVTEDIQINAHYLRVNGHSSSCSVLSIQAAIASLALVLFIGFRRRR